jgi:hypothetical protein
MTGSPQVASTADCRHCAKGIRRYVSGIWGARRRSDPHPWYCDSDPGSEKRHEPAPVSDGAAR